MNKIQFVKFSKNEMSWNLNPYALNRLYA